MRFTKWEFAGKLYYLSFNGAAMHMASDLGVQDLTEPITNKGREYFSTLCKIAAIMIEQGELVRRYMGYDPGNVIDASTLEIAITPYTDITLRNAMMQAVVDGYSSEIRQTDEVDLGLLELQKKNVKG